MKNLQISERRLELREKFEKKNRFLQWLIPVKCRSLQKEEKNSQKHGRYLLSAIVFHIQLPRLITSNHVLDCFFVLFFNLTLKKPAPFSTECFISIQSW